ncbi:MAG: GAF domain-containing protein [Lautropia sp.]
MPMSDPAFGHADLTNCERELIQFAGSIQPSGLLLLLRGPDLRIVQASRNVDVLVGVAVETLLGRPVEALGGDLASLLGTAAFDGPLDEPVPIGCTLEPDGRLLHFEGSAHRVPAHGLIVELEPRPGCDGKAPGADAPGVDVPCVDAPPGSVPAAADRASWLERQLPDVVRRFGAASSIGLLADAVVRSVRDITGYDRVMVYRFDPDGHGQIIAEAADPRLDPLIGHRYPATDIPQRARQLYIRNRVRVLVDVHYEPVPLVPAVEPDLGPLDMSMCHLRSMSPLHLQYLKNMGVTATLVVSLVRDGALWGLIAAHHYQPRRLDMATRAAMGMLAEVASTRLAAIECYTHAQVAILVRRLEQRLIEATSNEGDWRVALFRNPRTLLQPLDATGAALFYDGEIMTAGEVPSTAELRELMACIEARGGDEPFATNSIARVDPALSSLTPVASGVLAYKLSKARPDYLMWLRKEQLQTLTWAGDPSKPVIGNDPLELSPRRSFAAWSEIVRGTALPWRESELAMARALGAALVDIVLQVHGVRLLIARDQLLRTEAAVEQSREPVLVADREGTVSFCNPALHELIGCGRNGITRLDELAALCTPRAVFENMLLTVRRDRHSCGGELSIVHREGRSIPVHLRIEVVPGQAGDLLGCMLIFRDLSEARRTEVARERLEQSLSQVAAYRAALSIGPGSGTSGVASSQAGPDNHQPDDVIRAILTNASIAAMDITDGANAQSLASVLEDVEAATSRATAFYARMRAFSRR